MNELPGLNYINMLITTISISLQMRMAYAESLARYVRHHMLLSLMTEQKRFFAQAWLKPIPEGEMLERTKVEAEITNRLRGLRRTLPDQFLPLIDRTEKSSQAHRAELSICAHARRLQRVHIGSRRLARGLHPPVWLYLAWAGILPRHDVRQWVDISRECFSCARALLGDLQADCAADQG
jgi:hypothetical protein